MSERPDIAPKKLRTGDELAVDFAEGGSFRRSKITLNGEVFCIKGMTMEIVGGEPTVVTIVLPFPTLPSQRGYFVAEDDMGEFLRWQMQRGGRR